MYSRWMGDLRSHSRCTLSHVHRCTLSHVHRCVSHLWVRMRRLCLLSCFVDDDLLRDLAGGLDVPASLLPAAAAGRSCKSCIFCGRWVQRGSLCSCSGGGVARDARWRW